MFIQDDHRRLIITGVQHRGNRHGNGISHADIIKRSNSPAIEAANAERESDSG